MGESQLRRRTLTLLGIGLGAALVLALLGGEAGAGDVAPASPPGAAAGLAATVEVPPLKRWRLRHANWVILPEETAVESDRAPSNREPTPWSGLDIGVVAE